jgi:DNA-binding NarL/FixJ family response regulator
VTDRGCWSSTTTAARAAGASAYLVKDGSVERLRAVLHGALAAVTEPDRSR